MNPEEPSLLSHLNDVRKRALDEGGITTIIYCGQVRSEADLMDALQVHRAIVEEEVNNEKVNVTGILMGQVNGIFHVLEGPSYSVLRILNNLAGHEQFIGQSPIQSGSIVYDTEDRPKRIYPEWFSCILSEQKAVEEVTKENSEDIVFDMATKILELGNKLRNEAQDELDLERYADKFPGRSIILALSQSADYFPLQEYVKFYYDPYHVVLDSEKCWPLERLVKY